MEVVPGNAGSSAGCRLMIRQGNARTKAGETRAHVAGQHHQVGLGSRDGVGQGQVVLLAGGVAVGGKTAVGMPAAAARSRARAPGRR